MVSTQTDLPTTGPRPPARPGPLLSTGIGLLLALTFVPLGYVAWAVVSTGPARIYDLVVRPRVGELLLNTVGLVVVTVPLCVVLGVGAAWLVERTDVLGATVWRPLLVAPLAVPAFINSYAWVSVWPTLHGFWAGVLVTTLSYFPFVFLPAAATLRRLDPAIEESARALGSGTAGVFFRVVLPQLRLAVLGGGLLIGVHLLAEYGAFAMLRFSTFTTAIFEQFQATFDGAAGATLAGSAGAAVPGAVAGRGAAARQRPVRPDRVRCAAGGHPDSAARRELSGRGRSRRAHRARPRCPGVDPAALAVDRRRAGLGVRRPREAIGQTAVLAAVAAALTTVAAFPFAWLAVRYSGVFARTVEGANFVTSSMPGIVTALALVTFAIRFVPPLYQTVALVLCAYVLMFLPRALVSLRAGLAQVPPGLEEASRSLGLSPARSFVRVTLRLTAPAAGAGAALVFVAVATELTATLLLAPTGTRTLAMRFWSLSSELDYAAAAPYALMLVALSIPVTVALFREVTRGGAS